MTAEFNRNVLHVLNRELGADFAPDALRARRVLRPRARVDRDAPARRRALHACASRALDLASRFAAGEELRTEISAKFTPRAARGATSPRPGCELAGFYTDPDELLRALARAPARRAGWLGFAPMQIEGQLALVAGGASGLGEATAAAPARARRARHDRRPQRGEGLGARRRARRARALRARRRDRADAGRGGGRRAAAERRRAAHRRLLRRRRLGREDRRQARRRTSSSRSRP